MRTKNLLEIKYNNEIMPELMKELEISNKMAVPAIKKVIINMGTSDIAVKNKEYFKKLTEDMAVITGQKPQIRPARISVAGFGVRAGMAVGLRVTLRSGRMYDFLQKLIAVVLPRIRDFRGISITSFDKGGNYTLGLREHTVFPEIDLAKTDKPHGLEIVVVTTAKNRDESFTLLTKMGFPFEKNLEQTNK